MQEYYEDAADGGKDFKYGQQLVRFSFLIDFGTVLFVVLDVTVSELVTTRRMYEYYCCLSSDLLRTENKWG